MCNELAAANLLWTRVPVPCKQLPQFIYFRELHNICVYLRQGDTCQALIALSNFAWPQELLSAVSYLSSAIRNRRWRTVTAAYKFVGAADLALMLNLSEEDVFQGVTFFC
jgi:hypothetical protein